MSDDVEAGEAVDPDVDLHVAAQRREMTATVLLVIALGGGVGALARYGLSLALPTLPGHFPLGTFVINVSGCFVIGVLMVLIAEVWSVHPLVRPFFGVGVLGGYTTFSTYAVETLGLLRAHAAPIAFGYFAGTLVCALLAVAAGLWLARAVTR